MDKFIWRKKDKKELLCACKKLNKPNAGEEIEKEIFNMAKLVHKNVVILYGVSCNRDSIQMVILIIEKIIFEFLGHGIL